MKLVTRLRISPGVWLAPLVFVILAFHLDAWEASGEGYGPSVAANDLTNLQFAVGLLCFAGAWEGARIKAGRVLFQHRTRSVGVVLMRPWLWSWAPAGVICGAYMSFRGAVLYPEGRLFLALGVVSLAAWAGLGLSAGLLAPKVVVLPVALAVPTIFTTVAPAGTSMGYRYLAGYLGQCCHVNEAVAPGALIASFALPLGSLCVAGGLAVHAFKFSSIGQRLLATALVIVGFITWVGGFCSGSTLGYRPVVPRQDATTCQRAHTVEVCVYPEHRDLAGRTALFADAMYRRWAPVTGALPARLDEAITPAQVTRQRAQIGLSNAATTDSDLQWNVIVAISTPSCVATRDVVDIYVMEAQNQLAGWLLHTSGMSKDAVRGIAQSTGIDLRWADNLAHEPAVNQRSAVTKAFEVIRQCQ